jgi:chaperone modulatory protein CbpM
MTARRDKLRVLTGTLLDGRFCLTLSDLCRATGLPAEALIGMVQEGLIEPEGRAPPEWRFSADCIYRLNVVVRLQRDLDVNLPGAALALDLLDELRNLRARVRALESLLEFPRSD